MEALFVSAASSAALPLILMTMTIVNSSTNLKLIKNWWYPRIRLLVILILIFDSLCFIFLVLLIFLHFFSLLIFYISNTCRCNCSPFLKVLFPSWNVYISFTATLLSGRCITECDKRRTTATVVVVTMFTNVLDLVQQFKCVTIKKNCKMKMKERK